MRYARAGQPELIRIGERPVLQLPGGGKIASDAWTLEILQAAEGRTLEEMLGWGEEHGRSADEMRLALACLSEAGLLEREGLPAAEELPAPEPPEAAVSAIIIGYQGKAWLEECIPSLLGQSLPPREIIVVDNASPSREMSEWMQATYPQVRVIRLDKPLSFAAANNRGVGVAQGDAFLFVNQDIRLQRDALANLVRAAQADPGCAAVGAKLRFWWAPRFLNGLGNEIRDHSWGSDTGIGQLDLGQLDNIRELPSMCLATALIPRTAWDAVGPLDEGFRMYYEDSEWSYRARRLGWRIAAAPLAVAEHAFGGRIPSGSDGRLSPAKQRNASYGRQRFILKLTAQPFNRTFFYNYLREDLRQLAAGLARLRLGDAWAIVQAYLLLLRDLGGIRRAREALHPQFTRSAGEVFAAPAWRPRSLIWNGLPQLDKETITGEYRSLMQTGRSRRMAEFSPDKRKPTLLILSNDIVSKKMAGPGLRYLEMARALSADLDVTLAVPGATDLEVPGLRIVSYRDDQPAGVELLVQNHDQSLVSGYMALKFPFLENGRSRIIVDWYDPFFLENYYYYNQESLESQNRHNAAAVDVVNKLARMGDFFICGNERQRDLWLGILAANGRVNPHTLGEDQSLRNLIDVVGVGIPEREPVHRPFLRGVDPRFPADCRIVLWGGGIWNWLDPLTLVRGWKEVAQAFPQARLVFLGTRHPNPQVPQHEIVDRLVRLAEESGEKERSIIFFEWLTLEEREALLCESDIGVTLHPIHAETRYSIRTRVLDYIWTGLPVLVTEGDVTSEWVQGARIGETVPPEDPAAVSAALQRMLAEDKESWTEAFSALQQKLRWEAVVQPLLRYCHSGKSAADHLANDVYEKLEVVSSQRDQIRNPFKKAAYLWATEGLGAMIGQTVFHIRWLLGRRQEQPRDE